LKLVSSVRKLPTQLASEIVFKELPEDDPPRRNPDISKAKKLLDWKPEVKLEEGLKRTIEWFEVER